MRTLKYPHKNGKPVHRVERLQHIVAWFDKYTLVSRTHS
jgi:hypothetical protein